MAPMTDDTPDPDLQRIVEAMAPAESLTTDELLETVEDLVRQFACTTVSDGVSAYSTGGLSALEDAFAALGWDDPHPAPEMACEHPGCNQWATCGTLTGDGYKRVCGTHFQGFTAGT
jgi:hypothetical protein